MARKWAISAGVTDVDSDADLKEATRDSCGLMAKRGRWPLVWVSAWNDALDDTRKETEATGRTRIRSNPRGRTCFAVQPRKIIGDLAISCSVGPL